MRDIFYKPALKSWLEKLFIVLLVDYLLLFGMETVSPGIVMGVLNLNYLLSAILGLLVYLSSAPVATEDQTPNWWGRSIVIGAGVFMTVITVFSLYKAFSWQITLYTAFSLIVAAILYKVLVNK